jgi:uncharacterized membrane protein
MKKYLITGFLTLLPLAVTIILIVWLFDYLTTPFVGVIENLLIGYEEAIGLSKHHETIVLFLSRVVVLVLIFFIILLLGFFAHKFFVEGFFRLANRLVMKIPILKTVYRMTQEVTNAVFSQDEKTFKRTVLIPFPNAEAHSFGLVTGDVPPSVKKIIKDADLTVWVPTAPQPISGFLLMTSKKNVLEIDVSTEDAFKFLLSCGTKHPGKELAEEEKPS